MIEDVDPEYVKMSSKVWYGKQALSITGEERQRIIAYASKSRQKCKEREHELQQQRTKAEPFASWSGNRPIAAPRSWIKQELSWTTKADPEVEAAPVVPEGGDAEMAEAFEVGELGNQDPAPKPLPGASKTKEPIHPKERGFIEEARRAMFDETERERLQAQNERGAIMMKREEDMKRLGPYDETNTCAPLAEFTDQVSLSPSLTSR